MPSTRRTARAPSSATAQIRAYLAAQPPRARRALQAIRRTIKAAAPDAVEHFSYRIPGFRLNEESFLWYAGFAEHASVYPLTGATRRAIADVIDRYHTSKGTIRFSLDKPVPVALVRRIALARAAEVRAGKGRRRARG
jgi:uncharacterized protein YdhG (YjbR/CyaY superfamily)